MATEEELMRTGILSRRNCCQPALRFRPRSVQDVTLSGILALWGRLLCACAPLLATIMPLTVAASQYVELDYNLANGDHSRSTIFLELFDDKAQTTANFLSYVNATNTNQSVLSNYSGSIMHRLARNFALQGGGYWANFIQGAIYPSLNPNAVVDLDGNLSTPNPSVPSEYGIAPIRSNLAGTVSMALSTGPNSATSQWFINLANNSFLDNASSGGPFTVFGQVAGDGMSLVAAYNSKLSIGDFNPDANNNGIQDDAGPFFGSLDQQLDQTGQPTDGVPYVPSGSGLILLVLNRAKQIDYLGPGLQTTVPAAGLTFSSRDAFIDLGSSFTGTGNLTIGAGHNLGIREGVSLGRDLLNHGGVSPGLQLGSITVQDYIQFADGQLNIQIASATPTGGQYADTQYDRVIATGSALLGGDLNISFLNYSPKTNDSFSILTAASIVGSFAAFQLPTLPAGDVWNISKSNIAYTLKIVYADFDHNGIVDMRDYVLWRNSQGTSVTAGSGADGDGNGFIDGADYAIWRANFGNVRGSTSGSGSGSLVSSGVPEPSSIGLVAMAAFASCLKRRRHETASAGGH
jgi:cyclophilin family peptidyl-prolyl cis-trans isomerase